MGDRLEHLFTYHAPSDDDVQRLIKIRAAALLLAEAIEENAPACADRTVAIRKVREAVMTANAAIVLKGMS